MTRSDLIERLTNRFHALRQDDVKDSVAIILDSISETLARGGRVEVRGFGSFSINNRQPRIGRNPKTGEKVQVPSKSVPHFKAGKEMRERVDRWGSIGCIRAVLSEWYC